jgi:hypothetical protein
MRLRLAHGDPPLLLPVRLNFLRGLTPGTRGPLDAIHNDLNRHLDWIAGEKRLRLGAVGKDQESSD